MRLVADTSVLFSFFNRKSKARELSTLPHLELYAPEFALKELREHKEDIKKWFSLSDVQYSLALKLLHTFVLFIPLKQYARYLERAMHISVDPDDIDFFALSLRHDKMSIWSEDPHFKMQSEVKVYTTGGLTELLSSDR